MALYAGYGMTFLVSTALVKEFFRNVGMETLRTWIEVLKKLFILGTFNQVAVFTQLLSFRLSYYILNSYFGKDDVGIYSNAVSIAESIWLIGRSIGTVQHSRIVNSHDNVFSLHLTSRLNRINLAISVVLIMVLAVIPESWYVFLFGKEFLNINHIIWTLSAGIVFFGVALVLGYYFSSTGKHFVNAIASSAGLIVTIILGLLLIPAYGIYGAGITASISYGVTACVVILFYIRESKKYL
jgi:O-antigen/teichoic acid export membrane protein